MFPASALEQYLHADFRVKEKDPVKYFHIFRIFGKAYSSPLLSFQGAYFLVLQDL